ncbi:NB-ARC and TPR domain protein [Macrophomina phaseolina]|uniref:NB-ARC and TPR domain protein n=1 Tax=Macrophomina phaseolina TaxID=35725 RepID=A0ABQ8G7W0_9PEZI|nr:NB-ARC and TPR domain protein [Macrophomina phaseolina]
MFSETSTLTSAYHQTARSPSLCSMTDTPGPLTCSGNMPDNGDVPPQVMRTSPLLPNMPSPSICDQAIKAPSLSKHIATHLQSISLISLPWRDGGDEATQNDGTASHLANEDHNSSIHDDLPPPSFDEGTEPVYAEIPPKDFGFSTPAIPEDSVLGAASDEWQFLAPSPYHGHDRDPILQTFLRKLYIESSPSMNDKEGPVLPCHFVPFSPNKNFFGRDLALASLEEALLPSSSSNSNTAMASKGETNPKTFAICGPGGMGKTQVAIEFVTRHRDKFDAIFWVHADEASKLAQDFNDIALRLGLVSENSIDSRDLTYTRELVKRWLVEPLSNLKDKESGLASWLLVYDGVEVAKTINEFWPYDGPGSVLVTSRNPFSWRTSWSLVPFTATEATDFLLQLTRREGDPGVRAAVATVSQRLGGLPLALTQMAGVITYRNMAFDEFIQAYNEREVRQELLEATPDASLRGPGYEHNLASVWALENLTHGATLLETLSMLDSDGITERLISENLGKVDLPGFPATAQDYQNAKDELLQSSLLTGNRGQKKFFVHRIVQDVARTRLSKKQFRSTFMACVGMVCTLWPFESFTWRHGTGRWWDCEELFPHVLKLKEIGNRIVPSEDDLAGDYRFARLLTDAGWYHHERGRSSESKLFDDMAQTICQAWVDRISKQRTVSKEVRRYLGDLHATLAEITHNRGCIASETNEPLGALHHFEQFNDMMRKEFDQEPELLRKDMRLAISWNELGNAYMLNKQWQRGEECFHKSIRTMQKLAFFKEINLSLPTVNLGLSYWLQGKHEEALECLEQGLHTRRQTYGSEDRESFITGRFLHALGNLNASMMEREESLAYHRKALLHYKSTLGNNHHRTADVCVKVAEHHMRLKQDDTALALLDHALTAYSNRETYVPEKARALFKRSGILRAMRKADEAEETLKEAAELYNEAATANGQKKKKAEDLTDEDFTALVAFWSR